MALYTAMFLRFLEQYGGRHLFIEDSKMIEELKLSDLIRMDRLFLAKSKSNGRIRIKALISHFLCRLIQYISGVFGLDLKCIVWFKDCRQNKYFVHVPNYSINEFYFQNTPYDYKPTDKFNTSSVL